MMSEQGVNGSSKKTNEKQSRVVEYISKLGLDEADLAKISKLLETIKINLHRKDHPLIVLLMSSLTGSNSAGFWICSPKT